MSVVLLTGTSIFALVGAGTAQAAPGAASRASSVSVSRKNINDHSTCTNTLVPSGSSGRAELVLTGYGNAGLNGTAAKVSAASVTGSNTTCSSPSGYSEATTTMTARGVYNVVFASPAECTGKISVPASLDCKVTNKTLTLTFPKNKGDAKVCKGTASCSVTFDGSVSLYDKNGGVPLSITFEGYVTAQQSGKTSVPVSDVTDRWTP